MRSLNHEYTRSLSKMKWKLYNAFIMSIIGFLQATYVSPSHFLDKPLAFLINIKCKIRFSTSIIRLQLSPRPGFDCMQRYLLHLVYPHITITFHQSSTQTHTQMEMTFSICPISYAYPCFFSNFRRNSLFTVGRPSENVGFSEKTGNNP